MNERNLTPENFVVDGNTNRIFSDGERQAPIEVKEAEPSHLARYEFALKFISSGDNVLDAPCGSGYGTKVIASRAAEVGGLDIHQGAVEHAREFFKSSNSFFSVGNMENMTEAFPTDGAFDVIVSFEGIEHVNSAEAVLDEMARVLKKDGKLIISTPRKPHGSPYHTREYSLDEFQKLLSEKFNINQMFGQTYTNIFDLNERRVDSDDYKKFNFIAVCSPK